MSSETTHDHSSEEGMSDLHQEVAAARTSSSIQPHLQAFEGTCVLVGALYVKVFKTGRAGGAFQPDLD